MDVWAAPVAAAAGLAAGLLLAGWQGRLYTEEVFREQRLAGRRLLAVRAAMAVATGAAWAVAFRADHYDFGPAALTAAACLVLIVLSSTDFERRRIPDLLTYPALLGAAAFCWAWPDRSVGDIWLGFAVALGAAVLMFLLGLAFGAMAGMSESAFGLGDVKLIGLIGLLLGWPVTMTALFLGVIIAGIPSLILLVAGRGRSVFSYGPYLAGAAVVALLWLDRFM